jgi:hypothetical protein
LFVSCPHPTNTDPVSVELTTSQVLASLKIDYAVPGESFTSREISSGSPGFAAQEIRRNFRDMVALITTGVQEYLADESLAFNTLYTIVPKTVTVTWNGSGLSFPLGESKVKMTKEGTTYTVYLSSTITMPNLSANPTRLLVKITLSGSEITVWFRYPDLSTPFDGKAYYDRTTNNYKYYQGKHVDIQYPTDSNFEHWMTLEKSDSVVTIKYRRNPQDPEKFDWLAWGDETRAMIVRADGDTSSYSYIVNNFWVQGTPPPFFSSAPEGPYLYDNGWALTESDRASFLAQNGTISAAASEIKSELGL